MNNNDSPDEDSKGEEDRAKWINSCLQESYQHAAEWRDEARKDYDYYAGSQWEEDETREMTATGKIPIVFNRVARTINSVSGLEVNNRQEVRYIPREMGDVKVNEKLTSAAKWVRDQCDAEDEESEMFLDNVICGMGWSETYLDYESDPEGQVCIDRVDPLTCGWDPSSTKRNLDDARYVWRSKEVTRKEFKEKWPDATPQPGALPFNLAAESPHDQNNAKFYINDQGGRQSQSKTITVVQFQWWELQEYYQVEADEQTPVELSLEQWAIAGNELKRLGFKTLKRKRRVYKQAFVNGAQLLEEGDCPCKEDFTLKCTTGLRDRNAGTWFGLVRLMRDPQRYANKWLSQIVYILSVNSKGGLIAETGAFENVRKAEEQWANPSAIIWAQNGALTAGKIQEKSQAAYPAGLDRLMEYALSAVTDVTGVNLELMGLADRNQAGYLEAQRKQAGVTILAIFFDSLRRYRKEQGRVLAYFIREYISDGRLIRVIGNDGGQEYIPLVRDPQTYKYDVIVDDSPTSPNQKEKVFAALSQLVPQLLQAGIPIPPAILDYVPLPEDLVQKWKEILPKPGDPPPPDPQVEAEKAKLQLKAQESQMNAQIKQQDAQLSAQLETQKAQNDIQLQREKMANDIELQREKAMAEIEIQRQRSLGDLAIKHEASLHDARRQEAKTAADIRATQAKAKAKPKSTT